MVIKNQTRNAVLVNQGIIANTFFSRLKGLMGVPSLNKGEGLLLKHEKSIHTFFMRFPIDVVYLNKQLEVIRLDEQMPPNRLGRFVTKSDSILELPAGTIKETGTTVGDHLQIEE